jgi:hypothetical protein
MRKLCGNIFMEHKATVGRKSRRAHDCTIATLFLAPGSGLAPKGRKDSAQGFNPGLDITFAGALKAALDPRRIGKAIHLERIQSGATREALRSRPRRRPRPRIRPRGVMEYWPARIATRSVAGGSVGVLRQLGIAPRVRGVGSAFRAHSVGTIYPGLKPWAKSLCPFGAGPWAKSYRPFGALSSRPVLDLSPVTFHFSHSSL